MTSQCSFCDADQQADRTISSNDLMLSFLSNPRLTEGHILVIPRRHIEPPDKLNSDELTAVYEEITRISQLLVTKFDGVDLWQKTRPKVAENAIKRHHLHFHLLPSNSGASLYDHSLDWSPENFTSLVADERDKFLKLLS